MARTKKLDFTHVESFARCSEGIHTVKLIEITEAVSQNGDDMLKVTFEVISGADKGCRVFDNFTLIDKALWKFKQFLVSAGVKADGKVAIDLDKLIGKVCDVNVIHEEYNGVTRAKIADYQKLVRNAKAEDMEEFDDMDDEEEEVEEVKPVRKAKAKPAPEPEPEDDDDDDWDDEEEEEEAPPPPKKKAGRPAKAKAKPAPEPEEDDDDDDDDWEDL